MTKGQRKKADELKEKITLLRNACNRAESLIVQAEQEPYRQNAGQYIEEAEKELTK